MDERITDVKASQTCRHNVDYTCTVYQYITNLFLFLMLTLVWHELI